MPQRNQLPSLKTAKGRKRIIDNLERWKKPFYPDLPGKPLTLNEWVLLSNEIEDCAQLCDPPIDVSPIPMTKEIVLDQLRVGLALDFSRLPDYQRLTVQDAIGICDHFKRVLERMGGGTKKRGNDITNYYVK